NEMYDELLTEEIIPEIKRESSEELTVEELEEMLKHLDHKVEKYDQAIEASENVSKRREISTARKKRKQDWKALQDYNVRNKSIKMVCLFLMDATAIQKQIMMPHLCE